ncbi:hypothetical protein DNH61_02235 [Paenibacillus sambharensis]|uniref:Uncharacterized protein n=1 Tax=Paenibacillus sambharensis TaxID=1803190 RepID=A0A2W1LFK3_9BACL|nr:hypothetical protein [Paenibacillus sambharensis]PZD97479.1 hypothetical protein DNH61_02235 [Paenibacillus sambharensis]
MWRASSCRITSRWLYSCCLRTAAGGGGKQIIDPKQQIQQAYFHDHEPESMDRIGGEVEQMDLFQRFMSVAWELWMERRGEPELAAPLS